MPYDIQNILKDEVEKYLKASGLLETLDVFRDEFKIKQLHDEEFVHEKNKSSFAKRYFENKAEVSKARLKVYYVRKKLAACLKKLAKLSLKLNDTAEACMKKVSVNLELVNALETIVHSSYLSDCGNKENKYELSDSKKIYSDLARKIILVLEGDENESEKQDNIDLMDSKSDNLVKKHDYPTTFLNNSNYSSEIQVIPDEDLRNIFPLSSVISLTSSDANFCETQRQIVNQTNYFGNKYKDSSYSTCTSWENIDGSTNVPVDVSHKYGSEKQSFYSESVLSSSTYLSCHSSNIDSNSKTSNEYKDLRKWCEDFLKKSNFDDQFEMFRTHSVQSVYSEESTESSSFFSSTTTFNERTDMIDFEMNEYKNNTLDSCTGDGFVAECTQKRLSSNVDCTNKNIYLMHDKDLMHFSKENSSNQIKKKVFSKEKYAFSREVNNRSGICKHLNSKNEYTADEEHDSFTLERKTPFKKEKNKECMRSSIASDDHIDLSYTRTIQSGSRLKIVNKKEDGISKCNTYRNGVLPSPFPFIDKMVDERSKSLNVKNCLNSKKFHCKSKAVGKTCFKDDVTSLTSFSPQDIRYLNEETIERINSPQFKFNDERSSSSTLNALGYFEFAKELTPFQSSSVINTCVSDSTLSDRFHPSCKNDGECSSLTKSNKIDVTFETCWNCSEVFNTDSVLLKNDDKDSFRSKIRDPMSDSLGSKSKCDFGAYSGRYSENNSLQQKYKSDKHDIHLDDENASFSSISSSNHSILSKQHHCGVRYRSNKDDCKSNNFPNRLSNAGNIKISSIKQRNIKQDSVNYQNKTLCASSDTLEEDFSKCNTICMHKGKCYSTTTIYKQSKCIKRNKQSFAGNPEGFSESELES